MAEYNFLYPAKTTIFDLHLAGYKMKTLIAMESQEAELIAVYGRRRVGKTFLIREFFKENLAFEFTGQYQTKLNKQLLNFSAKLDDNHQHPFASISPKSWQKAFLRLKLYLEKLDQSKKIVVFIDEFPWLDTPKSGFLGAFDCFWNDWASRKPNLKIIICGSAASWIIKKVVQNKGGLHNRITQQIALMPFNLYETELYFLNKNIILDRYQIIQLYMAFGGIPHYLKE